MPKKAEDYIGYGIGDIITLTDLQTQSEYNKLSADFRITEVREYSQPEGAFNYTSYIADYKPESGPSDRQIMFMVLQVGSAFELRVYTLNMEGTSEELRPVFDPEKDDLIDRFEVDLHFDDGPDLPVTWDKQGKSAFGVEVSSTESEDEDPDCKTIAEYFTNDEAKGNPHCFVEWTGDKEDGYVEVWYGCEIQTADVELFHVNS